MRELVVVLVTCCCAIAAAEPVALVADRLIDGRADEADDGGVVVVVDGIIRATGDRKVIPDGATVIELHGTTLMPGMIDAHAHPLMTGDDYQYSHMTQSSAYKVLRAASALQELLRHGWTGMRIMGDADVYYGAVEMMRAVDDGVIAGPRLAVAAHYISITGGGGDNNFMSPEQRIIADGLVVDGVDEMRRAIRNEVKYGSNWIKILATGAYLSVGDSPKNVSFSPQEFQGAIEEANRQGVPVAAHAHATAGIRQAVLAGVRSIEHGTFLDDEVINLMAKRGTFLVPTIYIGEYYADGGLREDERNQYYLEHEKPIWLEWLRKAHRKGVKIGVGVDLGGYGYRYQHFAREFAMLTQIGMSNMEAIQAGTRVNAELLMWDDIVGTIEAGKQADIIAVRGNPLADIAALEAVTFVMSRGKIVKQPHAAAGMPQ